VVMAAGTRDGVEGSLRAASCSGVRVTSSEARLDRGCSMVRAPMSVEVTAGRLRTQASATSAELTPSVSAPSGAAAIVTTPPNGPPARIVRTGRASWSSTSRVVDGQARRSVRAYTEDVDRR
jgi:hypothetical protein